MTAKRRVRANSPVAEELNRQLPPVSDYSRQVGRDMERWFLTPGENVGAMPEPGRTHVVARFERAERVGRSRGIRGALLRAACVLVLLLAVYLLTGWLLP